jgi:molybdate transport system ATP-binding protein
VAEGRGAGGAGGDVAGNVAGNVAGDVAGNVAGGGWDGVLLRLEVARTLPAFSLEVRLEARDEVLVLFGPSGAGKTTVLNMVAGLVHPDSGVVEIGDAVAFDSSAGVRLPPRARGVGYVMQQYALFPHMSALENVMFPLQRAPRREGRARELLELLGMGDQATRRPAQLSGGQQQRVAIARALAAERRVLLLDEPFAALDGAIRHRLQADLRRIRAELGVTALLVTHQLEDAFAVGDRMAVMLDGRVEQCGPVREVFARPATPAVAGALGLRNLFTATVARSDDVALHLDWLGLTLLLPPDPALPEGATVTAYIQPDDVKFVYPERPLNPEIAANVTAGRVVATREGAGTRTAWVSLGNGAELEVRFPRLSYSRLELAPGTEVRLALRTDGITLLPL